MEDMVQRFNRRLGALKTERSSFISHWTEISEVIRPRSSRFLVTDRNRGDKRTQKINDNTATMASRALASGLMAGVTSPARPWFQLRVSDPELNQWQPVKVWLDKAREIEAEVFRASNLYTILPGVYADLGDFGVHAFTVLEDTKNVIRCYPAPIGSYMLGTNDRGVVDAFYREFQMTAGQMVSRFGETNVSLTVLSAYRSQRDTWFNVVHVVEPNDVADSSKLESKFKAFREVYYEPSSDGTILSEKGFDDFPVMAPRWDVVGEDIYGSNSPGMDALGDIRALQIEQKRKVQGIEKLMNPPMNAPNSMRNGVLSQLPGGVNFLDVNQGQQGFTPAYQVPPGFIQPLMEDIQELQQRVKRAYYEDLFLLISSIDRSGVTAEEIVAKKEEKLLMLGPAYLRLNDELLEPLVARTFNIMWRNKEFPQPPMEILRGADINVEFTSVMAQAMKLAGLGGIERLTQYTGGLAAAYPEVLDKFDADAAVEEFATMLGTPARITRDAKDVEAIRAARAQQQKAQQALAMAQQGAQTAQIMANTNVTDPSLLTRMSQAVQGAS